MTDPPPIPYQELLDGQNDVIFAVGDDGVLFYANTAYEQLVGVPFPGRVPLAELVAEAFLEESLGRIARMARHEQPEQPWELQIRHASGELVWVEIRSQAVYDEQGRMTMLHGVARDIRERRELQERLQAAMRQLQVQVQEQTEELDARERRFQELTEMLPVTVWEMDLTGRFTYANRTGYEMFGLEPDAMERGVTALDLIAPQDQLRALERMRDVAQGEPERFSEYTGVRNDGTTFPVLVLSSLMRRGGEPVGFRGVIIDITERKQMEEALRESEARYRQLVQHAPAGIYEVDLVNRRFLSVNDVICEYTGYTRDELLALEPIELLTEESQALFVDRYQRMFAGESIPDTVRYSIRGKDGHESRAMANIQLIYEGDVPARAFVVMHDITEHEQLEEQLRQAQKMKAVGTLAGGVAHDFNNLLMGILGHASLMRTGIDAGHPHDASLRAVEELVQKAANLTRQLLGFARGGKYETRPWDPGEILADTAEMFGRTRKEIDIHRKIAPELSPVRVDRGQIEQVLMNVFINAWQAMPDGGRLFLQARDVVVSEDRARTTGVEPGTFVMLSVTDEGEGMPPEVLDRAFEPFFTTRELGQGTGLGLASAYGIARNHEGFIELESEPGGGTTVALYLPARSGDVSSEFKPSLDPEPGEGTVLVVDDEDEIRSVTQEMIDSLGYRALAASDGQAALALLAGDDVQVDLVLLDLTMPGLGGVEVFEALRAQAPALPVLLSSGYSLDAAAKLMLEQGPTGFLQKPFDMTDLSLAIRALLDPPEA